MAEKLKQEPETEHMNSSESKGYVQEDELPTLSTDIIKEIFLFLPLKSLLRFKSVSKTFRDFTKEADFISKHSLNTNPTSSSFTGLFYQTTTYNYNMDVQFLPTNSDMSLPGLGFMKERSGKQRSEIHHIHLIDSCNGLLLCSTTTNAANDPVRTVYVCNPLTRQKVAIPHPPRRYYEFYYALLANLTDLGVYKFKVFCLYCPSEGNITGTEMLVYSSETGEWEEEKERLPVLPQNRSEMGSKVFFKGKLFWDCFRRKILVCHMKKTSGEVWFELIDAPASPRGKCLFIFDQKLICYCHKLFAWSLHSDDTTKSKPPSWEKLGSCTYFKNLKKDLSRICREYKMNLHSWYAGHRYEIIAFDYTSGAIILLFYGSIFSYQVKERRFEVLVRENSPTGRRGDLRNFGPDGCAVSYTHCFGKIQVGNGNEMERGKNANKEENKRYGVHVKDDDIVDWKVLMEKNANKVKQRGRRR